MVSPELPARWMMCSSHQYDKATRRNVSRGAWVEIASRAPSNMTFVERTVNGQPGLVAQQDGVTVTVFAFDVAGGRIRHVRAVRNPEKLRPWTTG
jgi:hypothetical protein